MIITTLPPAPPQFNLAVRPITIPFWALDGRELKWNATRTAFMVDCTDKEYHSDRFACSSTALKAFARSPRYYLNAQLNASKDTKSRRLGTGVHARVLERARFDRDYVCYPGKRSGEAWRNFKDQNRGKVILTDSEWDLVVSVSERVLRTVAVSQAGTDFTIQDMVENGNPEQTIYWIDDATGVTCKARLDLTVQYLTFDIKTTDDARKGAFQSQSDRLGYDIQAAFYLRGRKAFDPSLVHAPFLFIAAELLHYGDVLVHQASEEKFIAPGDDSVSEAIVEFANSKRTGRYRGYKQRGEILELPFNRLYPRIELH